MSCAALDSSTTASCWAAVGAILLLLLGWVGSDPGSILFNRGGVSSVLLPLVLSHLMLHLAPL